MTVVRAMAGGLLALGLAAACGDRQGGEGGHNGVPSVASVAGTAVAADAPPRPATPPASPTITSTASPVPTPPALDPAAEVRLTATAIWATNPPPTPRTTDPDLSQASPPPGIPAIRPSKPSAGPDDPAFTEQDARDFIQRHGVQMFRIGVHGPVVVERVEFVRGQAIGWGDYALLCLVTVRGDFQLVGGPRPATAPPITFATVTHVFDAHTGYLLGSNASPAATPTR